MKAMENVEEARAALKLTQKEQAAAVNSSDETKADVESGLKAAIAKYNDAKDARDAAVSKVEKSAKGGQRKSRKSRKSRRRTRRK